MNRSARRIATLSIASLPILFLLCAPAVPVSAQDTDASARAQVLALEKAWLALEGH